jgi:hypothetical protein
MKIQAANRLTATEVNANKIKTAKDAFKALSFLPGIKKNEGIMAELEHAGEESAPKGGLVYTHGTSMQPRYFDHMKDLGVEVIDIEANGRNEFKFAVKFN